MTDCAHCEECFAQGDRCHSCGAFEWETFRFLGRALFEAGCTAVFCHGYVDSVALAARDAQTFAAKRLRNVVAEVGADFVDFERYVQY